MSSQLTREGITKRALRYYRRHGFKKTLTKILDAVFDRKVKQEFDLNQESRETLLEMYAAASRKSNNYVPISETDVQWQESDIKYLAFYLPQFHPFKENDEWWGRGFTEWTNVSKAVPLFKGHHQPHLPGELGFYDLRIVDVMRRQAELAKKYGVYGFCFHHYWFGGKRLLERPVNQLLANPDIDIPFCLCWANENWTRRWDGMESDILIQQNHSPEDDIAFIEDIIPAFKDSRYIRIDGKPVLVVYRTNLLPDARATGERWREHCRKNGIGEIYLISAQTFFFYDCREIGFDASVEFPPHGFAHPDVTHKYKILNEDFSGKIIGFREMVEAKDYLHNDPYTVFKTVVPGWDNTARKPLASLIFHEATPELYKEWLINVSKWTKGNHSKEEQFVFINAWNEWAEGAHLEPDRKYGYGFLHATAEALLEYRNS